MSTRMGNLNYGRCENGQPAEVELIYRPLPHHVAGLQYTATGYGAKIPTEWVTRLEARTRRVYCTIYSNAGTCWVVLNGKKVVID